MTEAMSVMSVMSVMSAVEAAHPLPLTGERTLPGVVRERYWFARHVAAYRWAAGLLTAEGLGGPRATVVDAGAGEGYGAALLARGGARVVAVELVPEVAAHIGCAYPSVEVLAADLCATGMPDASIDAVVSNQVVEHLPDLWRALAETARILRPGGLLVCATPNRLTFAADGVHSGNCYHVTEMSGAELRAALAPHLEVRELCGMHHGPRLAALDAARGATLPERLVAAGEPPWPPQLEEDNAAVEPSDFVVRADDVDVSLDLVAIAVRG